MDNKDKFEEWLIARKNHLYDCRSKEEYQGHLATIGAKIVEIENVSDEYRKLQPQGVQTEAMNFGGYILGEIYRKILVPKTDSWYHNGNKVSIIDLHKSYLSSVGQDRQKGGENAGS